jgi:hypothetical protein
VPLRLSTLTPALLSDALTRIGDPATRARAEFLRGALIPPDVAVRRGADIVASQ